MVKLENTVSLAREAPRKPCIDDDQGPARITSGVEPVEIRAAGGERGYRAESLPPYEARQR